MSTQKPILTLASRVGRSIVFSFAAAFACVVAFMLIGAFVDAGELLGPATARIVFTAAFLGSMVFFVLRTLYRKWRRDQDTRSPSRSN